MHGNTCPVCSGHVMTYQHFFWKHEPFTHATCGTCTVALRRSRTVFLSLPCLLLFIGGALLLVLRLYHATVLSKDAGLFIGVAVVVAGALLTNYLSFRFVGWAPATALPRTPRGDA